MTTLVVSDLHLGTRSGLDLLRRDDVRETLFAQLDGVDEVVLLGDAVEMREAPIGDALAASRPFFEALGRRLAGRPVRLLAGNHDHPFVAPWLQRHRARREGGLGPAETAPAAEASPAAGALDEWLGASPLTVAYPGTWLADGVYATHGHYLDVHNTVPALETLGARAVERVLGRRGELPGGVEGYEATLAPLYALLHELVQHVPGHASAGAGPSQRAYRVLSGDGPRPLSHRLLGGVAFPAFVAGLNRAGLGPVSADISGPALRAAALGAMGEVARRLVPEARHVVFGHTHRFGPLPTDDPAWWAGPGGVRLHNCGSWIFERHLVGETAAHNPGHPGPHPYWPGGAVRVEGPDAVTSLRLLDARSRADLIGRPA